MEKKLLNVTDLSSYLYCPRQFYIKKIFNLREPPSQPMIKGKIKHEIIEKFSKNIVYKETYYNTKDHKRS